MSSWGISDGAVDLAAAVIEERPGLDQMQLHKVLYFVQAANLAWFDEPAFEDQRIEAWQYGPMVRGVAGLYKDFGRNPITEPVAGDSARLSKRTRWVLGTVLSQLGEELPSGPALAKMTKRADSPWKITRGDLPASANSDELIPDELIHDYHKRFGVLPVKVSATERELAKRFLEEGDESALADLFEEATGVRPAIA